MARYDPAPGIRLLVAGGKCIAPDRVSSDSTQQIVQFTQRTDTTPVMLGVSPVPHVASTVGPRCPAPNRSANRIEVVLCWRREHSIRQMLCWFDRESRVATEPPPVVLERGGFTSPRSVVSKQAYRIGLFPQVRYGLRRQTSVFSFRAGTVRAWATSKRQEVGLGCRQLYQRLRLGHPASRAPGAPQRRYPCRPQDARLHTLQCRSGREGAIRHDRHGQASTDSALLAGVGAELPESPAHTCGGGMRGSHLYTS